MDRVKRFLDGFTGHRTMILAGIGLIAYVACVSYCVFATTEVAGEKLELLLDKGEWYALSIVIMATALQSDKVAVAIRSRWSGGNAAAEAAG